MLTGKDTEFNGYPVVDTEVFTLLCIWDTEILVKNEVIRNGQRYGVLFALGYDQIQGEQSDKGAFPLIISCGDIY